MPTTSSLATALSGAATNFAAACLPIRKLSPFSADMSAQIDQSTTARSTLVQAIDDFRAQATTVDPVTVGFDGQDQPAADLALRMRYMLVDDSGSGVGCLGPTDAEDAATAFAGAASTYAANGD